LYRNGTLKHHTLYSVALLETAGQGIFQLVGIKIKKRKNKWLGSLRAEFRPG
jgi:hypothetical protein